MTTLTKIPSSWTQCLKALRARLHRQPKPAQTQPQKPQSDFSERDFIMETLDRHPSAFDSAQEIEHLACLYRGRF